MRISDQQIHSRYDTAEQESPVSKLKNLQTFESLFRSPPRSYVVDEDESAPMSEDQERLTACFTALMKEENAHYQDSQVSIQRTGEGQLRWRLLSGAMKGCTLYVRWRQKHISVEISAPEILAKRLVNLREAIEQRVASQSNKFLIEIRITSESGYV